MKLIDLPFSTGVEESRVAAGATSHLKDLLETGSFSSARAGNKPPSLFLMNRFSDSKERFNEPSSRPSYDQSQNQRGQTGLADAAFVVRDRKAYQEEFRDDSSTVSSTRPSRMSSRPGSSKRTVREMNQDRKLLERLDLENRQLEKVPDLRQEESLKLINLQQNRINDLTNLKYLWNLVFLDLYDNEISNLFHLQVFEKLKQEINFRSL